MNVELLAVNLHEFLPGKKKIIRAQEPLFFEQDSQILVAGEALYRGRWIAKKTIQAVCKFRYPALPDDQNKGLKKNINVFRCFEC